VNGFIKLLFEKRLQRCVNFLFTSQLSNLFNFTTSSINPDNKATKCFLRHTTCAVWLWLPFPVSKQSVIMCIVPRKLGCTLALINRYSVVGRLYVLTLCSSGQSSWLHNGDVSCFLWGTNWIYICYIEESRPLLWSSGQSSWLHNGDTLCFLWGTNWIYIYYVEESRPPLWSSGQSSWLQIRRSRVRFPTLPDFVFNSGSEMGSTQPREYNWGAISERK
jgi:hypothetical protein